MKDSVMGMITWWEYFWAECEKEGIYGEVSGGKVDMSLYEGKPPKEAVKIAKDILSNRKERNEV